MPLIRIQTSASMPEGRRAGILSACSKVLAETTGKPEKYCMAVLDSDAAILMAGKQVEGAFVDIRGIGGLTPTVNRALSKALCDVLNREAGIDPANVYVTFTDVPAANWGWNGSTFG